MAAQNEFRKRGKKHFGGFQHHAKRWRGSRELDVGMEGILITCNMNQKKCTAEAFDLLNEYADLLYGPEFQHDAGGYNDEYVEEALQHEMAQLRAYGGRPEPRFQALESGANNVIFIRTRNLESDRLVHYILSDLHATKKKKTRIILRMLPVMGTCRAFPEDIMRYLATFLEPWFKRPNRATYQIAFKSRNNSHNKRDDVIKAIAGLVGKLNPKNKVNLTHPDLTIMLEVIKGVCCVSVVREYMRFRKYNLQEVVKDEEPKKEEGSAATEKAAEPGVSEENAAKKEETNTGTEKASEATAGEENKNEETNTVTEKASETAAPAAGDENAAEKEETNTVTEKASEATASEEEAAKEEAGDIVTDAAAAAAAADNGEAEAAKEEEGNIVTDPAAAGADGGEAGAAEEEEGEAGTEMETSGTAELELQEEEEEKEPNEEDMQEESAKEDDDDKCEVDGK
ncbi:THUMP domain-containing protein 1 isoform X2 [Syngnathoides biaculeatus]|uniref:THUMP domain-containing protein 1 isoform X2 n=1 Tax=Syngnathoides biaculeatus TaxID=300417 RepID=UPI002ADE940A|nr:THUMP domain-containing protein 1 isoform X2 [Syngnathoides biaculeatus]